MQFKTESSSCYELDIPNKRIRRLSGAAGPTIRQGTDGDWKHYCAVVGPIVGESVLIVWEMVKDDAGDDVIFRSTLTSTVVELSIESSD